MSSNEIIKECRKLAKQQDLEFKRSKRVGKINGSVCYEIHSGIQFKVLQQGCLNTILDVLLSESLKGQ